MAEIARAEGVSRSWISREAHSSEVRHRIAEAINARADRVGALIDHAFDAAENQLSRDLEFGQEREVILIKHELPGGGWPLRR